MRNVCHAVLCCTAALLTGVLAGRLQAAEPSSVEPKFEMNPKLVNIPDNTWVQMAPKFEPKTGVERTHSESVLVYDDNANRSVWWGGCGDVYTNETWVYDCSNNLWKQGNPERAGHGRGPAPEFNDWLYLLDDQTPRGGCSYGASYDAELKALIYGQSIESGWHQEAAPREINAKMKPYHLWLYRAGENRWEKVPPNAERAKNFPEHGGGYKLCYDTKNKRTLLFGGLIGARNEIHEYDSKANVWKKLAPKGPLPPGRIYHTWVFDEKRGVAIAHGGIPNDGSKDDPNFSNTDTWEYDYRQDAWAEIKTPHHPSAWCPTGPAAYDVANGVVVRYLARPGKPTETWVYDPAQKDWIDMKPAGQPQGREYMARIYGTCYDRVNNVTLGMVAGQTWVYRYKGVKK